MQGVLTDKNDLTPKGDSNPELAKTIASCLNQKLGDVLLDTFPDGETKVEIIEPIRGHDVFVIQVRRAVLTTCTPILRTQQLHSSFPLRSLHSLTLLTLPLVQISSQHALR